MTRSLVTAGSYNIEEASLQTQEGISLSFVRQVSGVEIFEDLFSPFISGNIYFRDTHNLPGLFGKSGMNILRLRISTPNFPDNTKIDGFFHVYKMTDRVTTKKREASYVMRFVSIESLSDQTKISKMYSGSGHEIVQEILEKKLNTNKNYVFSKTNNDIKFVSNFWSPTKNISYVAEHSKKEIGVSNYLFYENRDGFNFINITDLSELESIQDFDTSDFVASKLSPDGHSTSLDPVRSYKSVIDFRVNTVYDYNSDYDSGMIKTRLYIADPVQKRYELMNYSLNADKAPLLNKSLNYSNNVINLSEPQVSSKIKFYSNHGVGDSSNATFIQNRVAQLRKIRSKRIEIEVLGRTDYTVGKKVYFSTEKLIPISASDDDTTDKLFSGYYIISAINHSFTADKHVCTMELINDSIIL